MHSALTAAQAAMMDHREPAAASRWSSEQLYDLLTAEMLEVTLAWCFQREQSLNTGLGVNFCNIRVLERVCILIIANVSNKSVIYST